MLTMRRLLFPALIVAIAVPAMAQRVQPVLPFAPRGVAALMAATNRRGYWPMAKYRK
jgi:hypothetical protein